MTKRISVLDCTLRDGGYINNWNFGEKIIHGILDKLIESKVEYIECGYLTQKIEKYDPNYSKFLTLDNVFDLISNKVETNQRYVVMINFGDYVIDDIPKAKDNSPIIRVCFHKHDRYEAINYCEKLIKKGYKVCVQAMAVLNYSDYEFLELIDKTNEIVPYAFYIVDSFGCMEIDDLKRLISISDKNLNRTVLLGYHSHNNLQQAYGNAKYFVENSINHCLIIDGSVYGMGRGAGNLNLELFTSFLNKNYEKEYIIDPMLEIMDDYLKKIYIDNSWGYSLQYYLSAQCNCHPNYASYFSSKNTLSNKSIKLLLESMDNKDKLTYSEKIADYYYRKFQQRNIDDTNAIEYIKKCINLREILILAPGKSIRENKKEIQDFITRNTPIIFSINVIPIDYKVDFLFCVNEKRVENICNTSNTKIILASNVENRIDDSIVINYSSYLTNDDIVVDNAVLMLVNVLRKTGVKKINIAGFDGYSTNPEENYFDPSLSMGSSIKEKIVKNSHIRNLINTYKNNIELNFITESLYNK